MLKLNGSSFTAGRARFLDRPPEGGEATAKVYVKVRVEHGGPALPILAQLDTGAAWSMLDSEIAEVMGLFELPGEQISISTRMGRVSGKLVRVRLTILADEGVSLSVESTVFVSPDWRSNFLGYGGLLDRIRFALDPGDGRDHFYFGGSP